MIAVCLLLVLLLIPYQTLREAEECGPEEPLSPPLREFSEPTEVKSLAQPCLRVSTQSL